MEGFTSMHATIAIQLISLAAFLGGMWQMVRIMQKSVDKLFDLYGSHEKKLEDHGSRLSVQERTCDLRHGKVKA